MNFEFEIFADYFQFYLKDEAKSDKSENDLDAMWSETNLANLLAAGDGFVAVGTVRNMTVPVIVEIQDSRPDEVYERQLFEAADHVAEASLEMISGRMVVIGCTEYYPDAPRISVAPDVYRLRIYYFGLGTLRGDGLEGDDRYHILIYPGYMSEPVVLKRWK